MLDVIKKWDMWGVFLLSAWPNAMFDLCGMCCGHLQMPFWKFITGLVLGKAFVKVCRCVGMFGPFDRLGASARKRAARQFTLAPKRHAMPATYSTLRSHFPCSALHLCRCSRAGPQPSAAVRVDIR
jgi:hypothetical protein